MSQPAVLSNVVSALESTDSSCENLPKGKEMGAHGAHVHQLRRHQCRTSPRCKEHIATSGATAVEGLFLDYIFRNAN